MQAGQSLVASIGEVIGRPKFDVILVWKNGDRQAFSDATVHPMGRWLLVSEYSESDNWNMSTTYGFHSDDIKSYTVRPRGT